MRASFPTVVLLLVLAVSVSAVRLPAAVAHVGVVVPFKVCGPSSDDTSILSIVSNEYPPVPDTTLLLNVTANVSKPVTDGEYTVKIVWDSIPLPGQGGNVSDFHTLPWPMGVVNITYSQSIPAAAPPGSYQVTISALDQNKEQVFCFSIQFTISTDVVERAAVASERESVLGGRHGVAHKLHPSIQRLLNGKL